MLQGDEENNIEKCKESFQEAIEFKRLMSYYTCAMMEVETKFKVLDEEFSLQHDMNPINTIKKRLKKPMAIYNKLLRRGYEYSIENVEDYIYDVAGIRIVCTFLDDVYMIAEALLAQDDITLVEKKDYIKNPKPNGYRSFHMIVEVPVFFSNEKRPMRVEIQIRTVAMDFWASLEHQMKYKQDIENADKIMQELKECADTIAETDMKMLQIRESIKQNEK